MRFEAGAWEALAPSEGVLAWLKDENQMVVHDGAAWVLLSTSFKSTTVATSPGLANTRLEIREEEKTYTVKLVIPTLNA